MTRTTLLSLAPGARFARLNADGSHGQTGTLLYANDCRARVKYDNDTRHVELADGTAFDAAGKALDISSGTEVVAI